MLGAFLEAVALCRSYAGEPGVLALLAVLLWRLKRLELTLAPVAVLVEGHRSHAAHVALPQSLDELERVKVRR